MSMHWLHDSISACVRSTDQTCWVLLTLPCPEVLTVSTCQFNRLIAICPVIPQTSIDHINVSSNLFVALTLYPCRRTLMVVMTGDVLISHQFIPYSHRDAFELVYQFGYQNLTIELLRLLSQKSLSSGRPYSRPPCNSFEDIYPSKSISFKYRYKTFQCTIKIQVSSQVEQVINTSSVQKSKVGVRLARIHPLDFPHDIDAPDKGFSSFILLWHTPWERRLLWIMRNEAQVAMHNIIAFFYAYSIPLPLFWCGDHLLMDSTLPASKVLPDHHEQGCYKFIAKSTSPRIDSQQCADYHQARCLIHFHMPLRC